MRTMLPLLCAVFLSMATACDRPSRAQIQRAATLTGGGDARLPPPWRRGRERDGERRADRRRSAVTKGNALAEYTSNLNELAALGEHQGTPQQQQAFSSALQDVRSNVSTGRGMYKSTDAGKTWTHLGLRESQMIAYIDVDPRDPNRLFVAVLGHPLAAQCLLPLGDPAAQLAELADVRDGVVRRIHHPQGENVVEELLRLKARCRSPSARSSGSPIRASPSASISRRPAGRSRQRRASPGKNRVRVDENRSGR